MYENYKLVVFNDGIGRTCFGELAEETESTYVLKNPAMIMVSPNEAHQMKVDVIPLFFNEFITPAENGDRVSLFHFSKSNITIVNVTLTDKILEHYFTKINFKAEEVPQATEEEPVVELFEK